MTSRHFALLMMLSGCASALEEFKKTTLSRAAHDLSCPQEQLQVTDLMPKNEASEVGVAGCGKKVLYYKAEQGGETVWMRTGDVQPQ